VFPAETHRRAQAKAATPADLIASSWSGYVRDPEVLEAIAAQFGDDRVWSSGQHETYGACPFVFLIERVLRLGATEEAEEETTALTFGGVAHDILERFHSLAKERPGGLPETLDAGAQAVLEEAVAAVRAEREDYDEWLGAPVLWRHTFRDIYEHVQAYLEAELPRLARDGHTPHAMEYAFGFDGDPIAITAADLSGERVTLKLRGRIDRVDLGVTKKHGERRAAEGVPMARGGYRPSSGRGAAGASAW
jgi:ATP-dependent helicase/DNAse subunit B